MTRTRKTVDRIAKFSIAAWVATLLLSWKFAPELAPIAVFCFFQNISFTIVSRARNSASLLYHVVAAAFSNGLYATMLFWSVDLINNGAGVGFVTVYAAACMSGSVFAHWLALRHEKGAGARRNNPLEQVIEITKALDGDRDTMVADMKEKLEVAMWERGVSTQNWQTGVRIVRDLGNFQVASLRQEFQHSIDALTRRAQQAEKGLDALDRQINA